LKLTFEVEGLKLFWQTSVLSAVAHLIKFGFFWVRKANQRSPCLFSWAFFFQLKVIDSHSGNSYNKVASAIKQGQIKW